MINNYHFKLIYEKTYPTHRNHSHRTGGRDDLSAKGCAHGCIDETCQRGTGHGTVQTCQDGSRNGIAMLGSVIGSGIAEMVIDQKLMVDNYFVCSIGRVLLDGEEKVVSVGCFNHVFTMPEDKLKEELKKSF